MSAPTTRYPRVPEGPVLVVGGAGYIGSHTVRMLQDEGVEVVVFDNLSTGHREAVTAPLVEADLADRDAIRGALEEHRPRSIIHFAAKCYVGESVENPAKYYRENVFYTWNLLEEMRASKVEEIVFSSTCATFGVPETVPITEDTPQRPINPYGRTKLHIEHMLSDYAHAYGLRFATLRYFNAAGAAPGGELGEDHDPETHIIPLTLQVAQGRRDHITIFGDDYPTPDGTCVRDYIHILDLADAHLRAAAQLQSGVGELMCNLGTGDGYSVRELIEIARRVTGHGIPSQIGPRRVGDPPQLVSGGSLANELLGWTPKWKLEDIVRDAWRFCETHPEGYGRRG
jgi:UDP-glucose-4-epimerase GalE